MSRAVLASFILLKCALQVLAVNPVYGLHRDEFLHLDQADHLAWGYLSVPPFTSWIAYLIQILGGGEFWVRFFPGFFGVLLMLVIWDMVKRLGGGLFSQSIAMVALLFSALIRINILFQPNSVDILCFSMVFYFLIRYRLTNQNRWLYFFGLSFAFGFLNKYTIVFLFLGLILALVISFRSILANKHFYFSLLIAFLVVSPNLIWQIQNGIPVLRHMELLQSYQLVNNTWIGFLEAQLFLFYPTLLIWQGGLVYILFKKENSKFHFIGFTYLFTIGLFTFFQAKGYYAMGLYPVLLAFGAVWVGQVTQRLKLKFKQSLRVVSLILPAILFLLIFDLIHPFYSAQSIRESQPPYASLGLNTWEDGKEYALPQDFADMLGWKELAKIVDLAYDDVSREGRVFVLCDNYGQAGAINFYSDNPHIQAFSMDADYLFWMGLEEPIENVILVKEKEWEVSANEIDLFDQYKRIGEVNADLAREKGTKVYLFEGAIKNVNEIIAAELAEEKKLWTDE